jgi:predicted RNase H-like nuclease (RuvC/YqgF family)
MNPIQKVIAMITDVETKTMDEGAVAQKEYETYAEWCEDTSKNLQYEIKTGKATKAELEATIEKMTANIEASDSEIERLSAEIATAEKDLKKAMAVRGEEHKDYLTEHAEEEETISMMEHAEHDIEKEMQHGGAAMLQTKKAQSVTQILDMVVQASNFSSTDASKLTSMLQSDDSDSDAYEELGAPAGAVYSDHGGGTVAILEKMEEKAKKHHGRRGEEGGEGPIRLRHAQGLIEARYLCR